MQDKPFFRLQVRQNFLDGLVNLIDILLAIDLVQAALFFVEINQRRVEFNVDC